MKIIYSINKRQAAAKTFKKKYFSEVLQCTLVAEQTFTMHLSRLKSFFQEKKIENMPEKIVFLYNFLTYLICVLGKEVYYHSASRQ